MAQITNFEEISGNKKYNRNDMVRLGCNDCEGCSSCCHNMEHIFLEPWDIWNMTNFLNCSFEQLLNKNIELEIVDGLTLPQLKMTAKNNGCTFLNDEGRCSIHASRPGICRLFPLGRVYEEKGFSYFLQIHECKKTNRTKVKIEKWLGIPKLPLYEQYICKWHDLLKNIRCQLDSLNENQVRTLNLLILREFFMKPYEKDDFYGQFEDRYNNIAEMLGL